MKTTIRLAIALGVGVTVAPLPGGGAGAADVHPAPDVQSVIDGNNAFAVDLYRKLSLAKGNLALSPYSISAAMVMACAGARGQTAKEMTAALRLPFTAERLNSAFGLLAARYSAAGAARSTGYPLSVANSLWVQQGAPLAGSFRSVAENDYRATIASVDFRAGAEAARRTINAWVADRTQQKIKDLIGPGALTPDSRMVLANALYFKGRWVSPFEPDLTARLPFYVTPDRSVDTPTMVQTAHFRYAQADGLQLLELPYLGGSLVFVALLPEQRDGLASLEQGLTAEKLAAWRAGAADKEVNVSLPKFTASSEFRLEVALKALGMRLAFRPSADFSGISGGAGLFLNAVLHKAFVDVSEEGTEAAAATSGVVELTALPRPRTDFRADHPFLYLIADVRSGAILFLGRVAEL